MWGWGLSPKGKHLEQKVELPRGRRIRRRQQRESSSPSHSPCPVTAVAVTAAIASSSQSVPVPVPSPDIPDVAGETPPRFLLPRSVKTVVELWRLWRHGLSLMPSIGNLEERWGARWRPRADRQLLGGDLGNRCLRLSLVGCSRSPKNSAIWSVHLADSWWQVATTGTTTQQYSSTNSFVQYPLLTLYFSCENIWN